MRLYSPSRDVALTPGSFSGLIRTAISRAMWRTDCWVSSALGPRPGGPPGTVETDTPFPDGGF